MDIQVKLVKTLTKCCLLSPEEFQNVVEVSSARVPIVKFYHAPTKLICDVSFKSGLSVYNTNLIKYVKPLFKHLTRSMIIISFFFFLLFSCRLYLSLDTTVKWLVCVIVNKWAFQNGLKDRHFFTSYALIWMVLFYLMTEKVVPSVMELRQKATKNDHKIIEGTLSFTIQIVPTYMFIFLSVYQDGTVRLENGLVVLSRTAIVISCCWDFLNSMPIKEN